MSIETPKPAEEGTQETIVVPTSILFVGIVITTVGIVGIEYLSEKLGLENHKNCNKISNHRPIDDECYQEQEKKDALKEQCARIKGSKFIDGKCYLIQRQLTGQHTR